jgi:hypothetical protein
MTEKTDSEAQHCQSISNPYDLIDFEFKNTPRDASF